MNIEVKTVCQRDMCTGCNACLNVCKKGALSKIDSGLALNVIIDAEKCVSCGLCKRVCPRLGGNVFREPLVWLQGRTRDEKARRRSTSGAFAYELSKAFIEGGGYAVGCRFRGGEFGFEITNSLEILAQFCGSKYVKSDTGDIYRRVKELLKDGKRVLFIGLPCQSAGLQSFLGKDCDRLYTADLVCHGTPSVRVLDAYLNKHGVDRAAADKISFRNGEKYELRVDGRGFEKSSGGELPDNTSDDYSDAFLKRLNHLEGCYTCPYKRPERVSDISLGDAWGTQRGEEELKKGLSLALPTTEKGLELIKAANILTEPIDKNAVLKTNEQLEYPFPKPEGREKQLAELMGQE